MTQNFVAETQISIHAPAESVWRALTDPALVKQYMYGTNLQTDWKVGSPITWKGEWEGKPYEDKGTVLTLKQDNNPTQEAADTMAEKNWGPVLEGIRKVAEQ